MKLLYSDNPLLRLPSNDVDFRTDDVQSLCDILMHYYQIEKKTHILGCSLPQFGVLKRMCLCKLPKLGLNIMVNPKIRFKFGIRKSQEGCESLGGKKNQYVVLRPLIGYVTWKDVDGNRHGKWFSYRSMRIIEHEVDHLNGILIDKGFKVC